MADNVPTDSRDLSRSRALPRSLHVGLAVAGYVLFVGASLSGVLAFGVPAIIAFLLLPPFLYFASGLPRAAILAFALAPTLWETLPQPLHALWYVALTALAIAWTRRLIASPPDVRVPWHYGIAYGGFLAAMVLSIHFSVDKSLYLDALGIAELNRLRSEIFLASLPSVMLTSALTSRRHVRTVGWGILVGGFLHSVLIFFVYPADLDVLDIERYRGIFGSAHVAGLFGLLYLFVSFALLVGERERRPRRVLIASTAYFLVVLFLTGSRTAFLALLICAGIAVVRDFGAIRHRIRIGHIYLIVGMGLLSLVALASVVKITPGGVYGTAASGRLTLIRYGLALFLDHAWTGVGIGMHVPLIQDLPLAPGFQSNVIHTYYVTLLAEMGLIGFLAFALIIGVAFYHFLRSGHRLKQRGDHELYNLSQAFFLSFVAVLVVFTMQGGTGLRLFWILAGVALALRQLSATDGHAGSASAPAA